MAGERQEMNDGWRARIGLLCTDDEHRDSEYWKLVPEGVGLLITRFTIPPYDVWDLEAARIAVDAPAIVESAQRLTIPKPRCISLACTAMSFAHGAGGDVDVANRITTATGIPATTAATAVVRALKALQVKRVAVATPYSDDLNQGLKQFLVDSGLEVVAIRNVGGRSCIEDYELTRDGIYRFVRETDSHSADAVFVSCTNFCPVELIEPLEHDLGKPVVTASQALLWHSLQIAKVSAPLSGRGQLYTVGGAASEKRTTT